jgi:hypothetical protein
MKENKLIAEFMEFPTHTDAVDDRTIAYYVGESIMHTDNTENENDFDVFHPDDMQFHTSWDWLMPVVETCYHNGADGNEIGDITHALLDCDIDHTYKAVVKFINEYNN